MHLKQSTIASNFSLLFPLLLFPIPIDEILRLVLLESSIQWECEPKENVRNNNDLPHCLIPDSWLCSFDLFEAEKKRTETS